MKSVFNIFFVFFCSLAFAQSANDTVDVNALNVPLLDSLIFKRVNQLRVENNIPKLFHSDTLDDEANRHVQAMQHARDVYYSESDSKAGECNSKVFVRDFKPLTYEELAKSVVQKWQDSPGHAKLILGEFFLYAGCGVSYMEWKKAGDIYVYVCFRISYWP